MSEKKDVVSESHGKTEFPLTVKDRENYLEDLKKIIMEQVGLAQSVILLQKTPKGEIKKRLLNPSKPRGRGNPEFKYVKHSYVSKILNFAFALQWNLIITKSERIGEEALVEGYIEITTKNGNLIKKYGYGGAKHRDNPATTWADTFKAATSNMLKNAAARLGVALDLYDDDDDYIDTTPVQTAQPEKATKQADPVEKPQPKITTAPQTAISSPDSPASKEQLATIKSLGGDPDDKYTRQEAANYIRQLISQKGANNG